MRSVDLSSSRAIVLVACTVAVSTLAADARFLRLQRTSGEALLLPDAVLLQEPNAQSETSTLVASLASLSTAACIDVLTSAAKNAADATTSSQPVPSDVLEACQARRNLNSSNVPTLAAFAVAGGPGASRHLECQELAHLYAVARHYSPKSSFSSQDFCRNVQVDIRGDPVRTVVDARLAKHDACVAGLTVVLGSLGDNSNQRASGEGIQATAMAAMKVCVGGRHSASATESAEADCSQYLSGLAHAPHDGFLDMGKLCDGLVAKNDLANSSSGASGASEENFVYSCVRHADDALSSTNVGRAADALRQRCEADLSRYAEVNASFCSDYSSLVRQGAPRRDVISHCAAQFQWLNAAEGRRTVGSAKAQPPKTVNDGTSSILPPVRSSGMDTSGCEEYLSGIVGLDLSKDDVATVLRLDCQGHFHADSNACDRMVMLFVGGDPAGACRSILGVADFPKPFDAPSSSRKDGSSTLRQNGQGLDLMGVCRRTTDRIVQSALRGDALRAATTHVCLQEFRQSTDSLGIRARAGCRFLADQLETATRMPEAPKRATLNTDKFCASLAIARGARQTETAEENLSVRAVGAPSRNDSNSNVSSSRVSDSSIPHDSTVSKVDRFATVSGFSDAEVRRSNAASEGSTTLVNLSAPVLTLSVAGGETKALAVNSTTPVSHFPSVSHDIHQTKQQEDLYRQADRLFGDDSAAPSHPKLLVASFLDADSGKHATLDAPLPLTLSDTPLTSRSADGRPVGVGDGVDSIDSLVASFVAEQEDQ